MAKARKILRHVNAVKSIRTVTRTMEMVASARFKRSHDLAVAARPYTDRLGEMVLEIIQRADRKMLKHPLLVEPSRVRKIVLLVLTSNRGLCGGFNSSVIRIAEERRKQLTEAGYEPQLHVVGKKGIQYYRFRNISVAQQYREFEDIPGYRRVESLSETLMGDFLAQRICGVEVAYMQFLSAGKQSASVCPILPLSDITPLSPHGKAHEASVYEFKPSMQDVLKSVLPATARQRIYQCFLDSAVSEQVMRIAAMHSATDSADDMIHSLSVRYNRTRQSQITTELSEIMGGRIGLE